MKIKSLNQAIDLSINTDGSDEHYASFEIEVEGNAWSVYAVHISHRDILCYCNEGIATFLVDSYGSRNVAELFDWEQDESKESK